MESKDLQEWISEQIVGDEMLWKGAFGRQVGFARDEIGSLLTAGLPYHRKRGVARVISTHRSKSITLPVYDFDRRQDLGLRVILRDNFYNWKMSVLSDRPVIADFGGLFKTTPPLEPDYTGNPLSPAYFEGFPPDLIFGYYEPSDKRRWSAEIWGDEPLWATVFLMMRSIGAVKPMAWHTRESHRIELDRQREEDRLANEEEKRRESQRTVD